MAEFKFSCPHCRQSIACDELWSGQQLQCPSCQGTLTVPPPPAAAGSAAAAPAAAAAGPMRLTITRHQPAAAPAPTVPPSGGSAHGTQFQNAALGTSFRQRTAPGKAKKRPDLKAYVAPVLCVIVAGIACYFGYGLFHKWQLEHNANQAKEDRKSDGGEMGHIANVYAVLDATDPARRESAPGQAGAAMGRARRAANMTSAADSGDDESESPTGPVTPPVYTLDATAAMIPDGPANGTVSGATFVAARARVDHVGQAQVLRLQQPGVTGGVDREALVYLHLNPGESLAGHSWTGSGEDKATGVSQVVKIWKSDAMAPAQQKVFASGYALKLQFGEAVGGKIPGKIYLAFPDAEKSVVAGTFNVQLAAPTMGTR